MTGNKRCHGIRQRPSLWMNEMASLRALKAQLQNYLKAITSTLEGLCVGLGWGEHWSQAISNNSIFSLSVSVCAALLGGKYRVGFQ